MNYCVLLADDIDFMVHGIFKYNFFGLGEVWITTTHVCLLIVMLILIGFAIAANRCLAKAKDEPTGFQNEQHRNFTTTSEQYSSLYCSVTFQDFWA